MDKIHDGIGDKLGLLIQWLATFVGGFVVAFITEYRLTLLLIAFSPLLALAGFAMAKVSDRRYCSYSLETTCIQGPPDY